MTRFGQLALLAALVLASSAQALSPSHGTVEDSLDPRMRTRSELDAPGMPPSFQALPAPVVPDVAGFVPESNTSSGGAVVRRSSRSRALAKRGSTGAGHLIKKRGRKCKVWKSDAAREKAEQRKAERKARKAAERKARKEAERKAAEEDDEQCEADDEDWETEKSSEQSSDDESSKEASTTSAAPAASSSSSSSEDEKKKEEQSSTEDQSSPQDDEGYQSSSDGCFPATKLAIPSSKATSSSLSSWWCSDDSEYAFMGFSYGTTGCPSADTLKKDFARMRSDFGARYVRIYGVCDRDGFNNDVVEAAAEAGIGVYALVWFGFDGTDEWKGRMADWIKVIKTNKKAPWVVRTMTVGSEPLFDHVLSVDGLVQQINHVKSELSEYGIAVSISEMPYGLQSNNNPPAVFNAIDYSGVNALPFFDSGATTGDKAWGFTSWIISYFQEHAPGKKVVFTQTGWPSNKDIWPGNSASVVASVSSEQGYYDLLDGKCSELKNKGVGWFAHIWSDSQLGGWGILDYNGQPKFKFSPRTSC